MKKSLARFSVALIAAFVAGVFGGTTHGGPSLPNFGAAAQANSTGVYHGRGGGWVSPLWAGNAPLDPLGNSGVRITLPGGRTWAAAIDSVDVDVDKTPILAVTVSDVTPGASWVLKLGDAPYDPARPNDVTTDPAGGIAPGRFLVDLREISAAKWRGHMNLEVRLFVASNNGSGAVSFGDVRLMPASSVAEAGAESAPMGDALRVTPSASAPWTLAYVPETGKLQLRRNGGASPGAGGLSITLPGFTEAVQAAHGTAAMRFEPVKATPGENRRVVHCVTGDADYELRFAAISRPTGGANGGANDAANLFRWTVTATWRKPHPVFPHIYTLSASPECCYQSAQTGEPAPFVLSKHRFGQVGPETGQAFLPCDAALGGSALYVQNLTALGPFFEATHTSAARTVSTVPEGFGFRASATGIAATSTVLPAGTSLTLADSFFALANHGSGDAAAPVDAAGVYLHLLATVYDALPDRPATAETDWHALAERTIKDIASPSCWSGPEHGYLRNYVNEPWPPTTGELTCQIYPLMASLMYEKTWDEPPTLLTRRIEPSLPDFYLPEIHSIRDWTSESHPTNSDSGALIGPLIQLAKAADFGVPSAKQMVRDSLDTAIALAHKSDYEFPVFYNPQTLGEFSGSEPDDCGAYAYLMLQAHAQFADDPRYLDEARRALAHIAPHGLASAYETPTSALSAVACAWMWKLTGDRSYLALSLVPLANVFRNCWLYEPGYGYQKDAHLFFTASAMPGVYTAPVEQYEVWLALREYDDLALDEMPYDARLLVSEFLKYGQTNLRAMYPEFMAPGSVAAINDRHMPAIPSLMIPVEDLNDGWSLSGRIGQEIYGAGGPLALAARAYDRIPVAGLTVHSEYPVRVKVWNAQRHILRLHFGGVASAGTAATHTTLVVIRYDAAKAGWLDAHTKVPAKLRIQLVEGDGTITDRHDEPGLVSFRIGGETTILVDAEPPASAKP